MFEAPKIEDFHEPDRKVTVTLSCGEHGVTLADFDKGAIPEALLTAWRALLDIMHPKAMEHWILASYGAAVRQAAYERSGKPDPFDKAEQ